MRPFSRPVIPDETVRVRRAQVHCTTRTGHGILGTGRNRHKDGKECTRCVAGPTPKNLVCRSRNRDIPAERLTQRQARSRLLGLRAIRDMSRLQFWPTNHSVRDYNHKIDWPSWHVLSSLPPSHTYSPPAMGFQTTGSPLRPRQMSKSKKHCVPEIWDPGVPGKRTR